MILFYKISDNKQVAEIIETYDKHTNLKHENTKDFFLGIYLNDSVNASDGKRLRCIITDGVSSDELSFTLPKEVMVDMIKRNEIIKPEPYEKAKLLLRGIK